MVRIETQPNAVPTRGSGRPDYSRIAVGSQKIAASQASGGEIGVVQSGTSVVAFVSGGSVEVTQVVAGIQANSVENTATDTRDDDIREWQSVAGPGIEMVVYPVVRDRTTWVRQRTAGGVVGMVSGFENAVGFPPHTSGEVIYRYIPRSVTSVGEFQIDAPASGRSLVVRAARASFLGASGTVLVGWKWGSGGPSFMESVMTANAPVDPGLLVGAEIRGPIRTVSGAADLYVNVRPLPLSGVQLLAVVKEG